MWKVDAPTSGHGHGKSVGYGVETLSLAEGYGSPGMMFTMQGEGGGIGHSSGGAYLSTSEDEEWGFFGQGRRRSGSLDYGDGTITFSTNSEGSRAVDL